MSGLYVVDAAVCRKGKFRRLVVCPLDGYGSVRAALEDARMEFVRCFGGEPQYGFMRNLPRGVEHGMEIGELMLLEAEWMLERCVAVGGKSY